MGIYSGRCKRTCLRRLSVSARVYVWPLGDGQVAVSLGGVDVHADNDFAFRHACGGGHLETARWVLSLGGVNVHAYNDEAFRWACANRHLETARWLVSLDPEKWTKGIWRL